MSLKAGNKSPMWKIPSGNWKVERHPYHQIGDLGPRSLYKKKTTTKPSYFFLYLLPMSKVYLNTLVINDANPRFFVLSIPLKFIVCLKSIKAACSGHFLGSISMRPPYTWIGGLMVNNVPVMQETWVQSLGLEDPLVKGMATHSSILAWRISWTEEPGRVQSMGLQSWKWLTFT